jgi:hypothetical protein
MTIRIAINGFGRIGRNVLRALYENNYRQHMQVVAINDLGDAETNAHLLKYDSVHGRFAADVSHDQDSLSVEGDRIAITAIRNPEKLPWKDHDGWRTQGDHFRTLKRCRRHDRIRRKPRHPDGRPPDHFQRVLHHQLPGAGGAGNP